MRTDGRDTYLKKTDILKKEKAFIFLKIEWLPRTHQGSFWDRIMESYLNILMAKMLRKTKYGSKKQVIMGSSFENV